MEKIYEIVLDEDSTTLDGDGTDATIDFDGPNDTVEKGLASVNANPQVKTATISPTVATRKATKTVTVTGTGNNAEDADAIEKAVDDNRNDIIANRTTIKYEKPNSSESRLLSKEDIIREAREAKRKNLEENTVISLPRSAFKTFFGI